MKNKICRLLKYFFDIMLLFVLNTLVLSSGNTTVRYILFVLLFVRVIIYIMEDEK